MHEQNLVHIRTQEKEAVTPEKTDPDLSVSVQESPAEAWVSGGWLGLGALSEAVSAWDLLKEVSIIFIILHHSLASGQTTGREHSPAHQ